MKNGDASGMQKNVTSMFGQMTEGFKSCLEDLWCLEINTMVVSDIGGLRFNPIHCYESFLLLPSDLDEFKKRLNLREYEDLLEAKELSHDINLGKGFMDNSLLPSFVKKVFSDKMFPIKIEEKSDAQFKRREIIEDIESLIRKYILLKERLRLAFESCVRRKEFNASYDGTSSSGKLEHAPVAPGSELVVGTRPIGIESVKTVAPSLPNLAEALKIGLLENSAFLRELRSLRELYYLVGGEDASDTRNFIDVIAAQTVIHMDGDVMNRFHKSLLHDSERDFLIQAHQQALSAGQENWKSLVRLIIESMQALSGFLGLSGRSFR